jgi:hypothetical protein
MRVNPVQNEVSAGCRTGRTKGPELVEGLQCRRLQHHRSDLDDFVLIGRDRALVATGGLQIDDQVMRPVDA